MKRTVHERLKFVDESGVTTVLTRLFGRAAPGERVQESIPKNARAINLGGQLNRASGSGSDDVG
jgi:hypothetical protein